MSDDNMEVTSPDSASKKRKGRKTSGKGGPKEGQEVTSSDNTQRKGRKTSGKGGTKGGGSFYCSTCDVHCPNEKTLEQHTAGKRHVAILGGVQKRDKHAMSSVFVGNLPKLGQIRQAMVKETGGFSEGKEDEKLKSDLMSLFSKYGDVSKIIIDKKHGSYCILEYRTPGQAQVVLSEHQQEKIPQFYGKKLSVKSRTVGQVKTFGELKTGGEVDVENLVALLEEGEGEVECALNMVDAAVVQTDAVKRKIQAAVSRIEQQLNDNLPFLNIRLVVYGSSGSGLGLVDSDVDISLMSSKRVERDDVIRVLKEKCVGVSHVHVIPAPGHGSITRFLDGVSNFTFDFTFSNKLGLTNTDLIKTILSYDPKLAKFIRSVLLWKKVILGTNFSKQSQPSSYSVTIMCLHYLRTQSHIPDFLDGSKVTEHKQLYDLDCGYVTDLAQLPPAPASLSVPELIGGFWKYYGAEFDQETQVVSLRGVLTKADIVVEGAVEGAASQRYVAVFKPSPLAVQDPFVLTHNLTHTTTLECAVYLRDCCRAASANWGKGRALHLWYFGEKKSGGGEMEEQEESKIPSPHVNNTVRSVGSKRTVEEMEH